MNDRPPAVSDEMVAAALASHWSFAAVELSYAPVGFGSHHWIAVGGGGERRFVTVDDLGLARMGPDPEAAFAGLDAAFSTAAALAAAGLDFVVAPMPADDGAVLHRLAPRFTVAVLPWVEGESAGWGRFESDEERDAVVGLLERLHAVDPAVAPFVQVDDHVLPCRDDLERALAELDRPWTGGPFSEPIRAALAGSADDVVRALARYDALAAAVRSADRPRVITHGEPNRANVLWTDAGPRLVDWDTVRLAPPERDRWMVDRVGDPDALTLYDLWWDLEEVGGGIAALRAPHDETADARTTRDAVTTSLRNLASLLDDRPG